MNRARIREIAHKATGDIEGQWPMMSNDLEYTIESAILRAIEELLAREPSEGMIETLAVPRKGKK